MTERKHNRELTFHAKTLRREMTREEKHLWYDFLRNYPVRFLRQKVIGVYIADFYCHDAGLVIELDGGQHFEEKAEEQDRNRTEYFKRFHIEVLRIPNNELNRAFRGVCETIDRYVKERMKQAKAQRQ